MPSSRARDRGRATEITSSARSACAARVRLGRRLRVEDELEQPGAVAQVDEDQAAVVAAAVDPAGHARARRPSCSARSSPAHAVR